MGRCSAARDLSDSRSTVRSVLVFAPLFLIAGAACQRANPAYHLDAAAPTPDGGTAETGPDATLGVCTIAADCARLNGDPVCGAWECQAGLCATVCADCTDADHDGFGVGAGCAGPDCDDGDPTVGSRGARSCYSGTPGTDGVGVCRTGVESCTGGVWLGTCSGELTPTGEACNGLDDDCDGIPDDGLGSFTCGVGECQATVPACTDGVVGTCVAGAAASGLDLCDGRDNDCDGQVDEDCPAAISSCVHVAPSGPSSGADGSILFPFRDVQSAVNLAATAGASAKVVCVAGGATCADATTYQVADGATITMANGVSVYGSYESTGWTRCPLDPAAPAPTTTLEMRIDAGLRFPVTVTAPTTLDGFRITRAGGTATVAAVTVSGAKNVTLSTLVINDAPQSARAYGVNLINGATASITHSSITGGAATTESYGVRSVG
jgi:hypothetical protein